MNFHDYAIEAIINYYDKKEIENFILSYLYLRPKYISFYRELRHQNYKIDKSKVHDEFSEKYNDDIERFLNGKIKSKDINFEVDLVILSVAIKFSKFSKVSTYSLFKEISNRFILKIFKPKEREDKSLEGMTREEEINEIFSRNREEFEDIDLMIKQRFFGYLPYIIYKLDTIEIEQYLQPLLDNFKSRKDTSYLLLEFIRVQDIINEYDKFWCIWNLFLNKIIEISKDREYGDTDKIIQTYLLAWSLYGAIWKESAKDWHSLKERDKRFFKIISTEIGHCPSTLYSISKLLTGIGSSYLNDGIGWISSIIKNNKNLLTDKLEPNTIFHIENLTRSDILQNSEKIKKRK